MNIVVKSFLGIMTCGMVNVLHAQQDTVSHQQKFTLGEVVVTADNTLDLVDHIDASSLALFAKNDVSKALDLLPGANISSIGARNESMIYIRGFDLRQVPLLIDGIPVYVPYDGYVDLARFTTFDLAAVQVSKGYTSVNYGPNALGGAVNLITRRPVNKLELEGATGWLSRGYRSNINIGSNLGKVYFQAGLSKFDRNAFPLPAKFEAKATQHTGDRVNSYSSDEKYHLKVAYVPNEHSEYALSYTYQNGEKGSPVYAGTDPKNSQLTNPRYWQWPRWDKQSLYFISNTAVDQRQYVKTRIYYDEFSNLLESYDDNTYSTITKRYAFKSYYDDYTLGSIVEYGKQVSSWYDLVSSVQYKYDVHREHDEGEPVRTMIDGTFTLALENNIKLNDKLLLNTGVSVNNRASIRAQNALGDDGNFSNFPANNNTAFNVQGQIQYKAAEHHKLNVAASRKTRFATTKDRYSYRMGTAIPNPELNAEYSINYELGYDGVINDDFEVYAALFFSDINNTILSVSNVLYDEESDVYLNQLQNVGKSAYHGFEVGTKYGLTRGLDIGGNYTYIRRKNIADPSLHFVDVPKHKLLGFVSYRLNKFLSSQVHIQYNSKRYSTSYGTETSSFTLLNASTNVHVWKYFSIEGGINNITDRHYMYSEGYPEPGRNFFVNLRYRL